MPEAITTSATNAAPVRPAMQAGLNGQASLSGRRRAAILLMALGEDVARELLHDLPDPMIELVAAEIASLDHVDPALTIGVLEDFETMRVQLEDAAFRSQARVDDRVAVNQKS